MNFKIRNFSAKVFTESFIKQGVFKCDLLCAAMIYIVLITSTAGNTKSFAGWRLQLFLFYSYFEGQDLNNPNYIHCWKYKKYRRLAPATFLVYWSPAKQDLNNPNYIRRWKYKKFCRLAPATFLVLLAACKTGFK